MKAQRCLIFISTLEHLPWGGCEELWYKTARYAIEQGDRVIAVVFLHKYLPDHLQKLREMGAELIFLKRPNRKRPLFKKVIEKIFRAPLHRKQLVQLEQQINQHTESVFLVSQAGGFDFAYSYLDEVRHWLRSQQRTYHIVVQNVPDLGFTLQNESARKQEEMFRLAKTVAFVAMRNKHSTQRILASAITNATIVNNPLNFDSPPPYLEYPELSGTVHFAVVAALRCFHKGQDILLQVLASVKWQERNWHLNLYGTGPDETYLRELADYYKISDRIRFHGHVADIGNIWRSNHIHILPSLGEGTPLALIESMYCGRPAITTDVGGNTEYCRHLQHGFIAHYPTPNELAEVMELAWEHREEWQQMGVDARKFVASKYDLHGERTLYHMVTKKYEG